MSVLHKSTQSWPVSSVGDLVAGRRHLARASTYLNMILQRVDNPTLRAFLKENHDLARKQIFGKHRKAQILNECCLLSALVYGLVKFQSLFEYDRTFSD